MQHFNRVHMIGTSEYKDVALNAGQHKPLLNKNFFLNGPYWTRILIMGLHEAFLF